MAESIERVFAEMSDFTRILGSLHGTFLLTVRRYIDEFLKQTDNVADLTQWKGHGIFLCSTFASAFTILNALIPKTDPMTPGVGGGPGVDVRLTANAGLGDGVTDAIKWLGEKLNDNEFLRSLCKASGDFCGAGKDLVPYAFDTTKLEANRTLLKDVSIQNGQSNKSMFDQQVQSVQTAAARLLETKSKGG